MRRRSSRVRVHALTVIGLLSCGCTTGSIDEAKNDSPSNEPATESPTRDPREAFSPAAESDSGVPRDSGVAEADLASDTAAIAPDTGAPMDTSAPKADASPKTDAAASDSRPLDTGTLDTGKLDTGTLDTGTLDTGSPAVDTAPVVDPPPTGTAVARTIKDVTFQTVRGETIQARLFVPAGTTTTRHPTVIVLHGSGGLFKDPTSADLAAGRTCGASMSSQFDRWAERLNARGYAALFPDSFGSRGYCDEATDPRREDVLPPVPGDENGKTRRLLSRLYDVDASARYLCGHDRVRCNAMGLLGFSNGGSAVAMGLHQRLRETLDEFALTTRAKQLGVAIPSLPTPLPAFRVGVAYYPGCGFDGLMSETRDVSRLDEFFYPRVGLQVLIGSEDALLEHCSTQAVGTREFQADTYATTKGLPDRYDIKVYPSAAHSFDAAGCEQSGADPNDPDIKACTAAVATTMDRLKILEAP